MRSNQFRRIRGQLSAMSQQASDSNQQLLIPMIQRRGNNSVNARRGVPVRISLQSPRLNRGSSRPSNFLQDLERREERKEETNQVNVENATLNQLAQGLNQSVREISSM